MDCPYRKYTTEALVTMARTQGLVECDAAMRPQISGRLTLIKRLTNGDKDVAYDFLDLLTKLRIRIYEFIVGTGDLNTCDPTILTANKQVYHEASSILHHSNQFVITSTLTEVRSHGVLCGTYAQDNYRTDIRHLAWPRFLQEAKHIVVVLETKLPWMVTFVPDDVGIDLEDEARCLESQRDTFYALSMLDKLQSFKLEGMRTMWNGSVRTVNVESANRTFNDSVMKQIEQDRRRPVNSFLIRYASTVKWTVRCQEAACNIIWMVQDLGWKPPVLGPQLSLLRDLERPLREMTERLLAVRPGGAPVRGLPTYIKATYENTLPGLWSHIDGLVRQLDLEALRQEIGVLQSRFGENYGRVQDLVEELEEI